MSLQISHSPGEFPLNINVKFTQISPWRMNQASSGKVFSGNVVMHTIFKSVFPAFAIFYGFATLVIHNIFGKIIKNLECTVNTFFMLSQNSANSWIPLAILQIMIPPHKISSVLM